MRDFENGESFASGWQFGDSSADVAGVRPMRLFRDWEEQEGGVLVSRGPTTQMRLEITDMLADAQPLTLRRLASMERRSLKLLKIILMIPNAGQDLRKTSTNSIKARYSSLGHIRMPAAMMVSTACFLRAYMLDRARCEPRR